MDERGITKMRNEYELRIWNMLKNAGLKDDSYLNVMDKDADSAPTTYIVYRANVSNVPKIFGDGKVIKRTCACEIYVFEQGTGNKRTAGNKTAAVEAMLKDNNIVYNKYTAGYDKTIDAIQTTFDFNLIGG